MALKFLNKKGWHTGSLRNIENVWKAEQKHDAETKKLDELRKQIQEERERTEFRLLQEKAGLVPHQERLEFLYDSGLSVGKTSEGFKALETVPKSDATDAPSSSASKQEASVPGALFEDKPQSANDAWRKLHSDPLLMIRQREQEALAKIKNNPVKMAMIRKSVEGKEHKKKDHSKKEKRKKHSSSRPKHKKQSDSEDDGAERRRKTSDENFDKKYHKAQSDSEYESNDGERKRRKDHYEDEKHKERSPSHHRRQSKARDFKEEDRYEDKKYRERSPSHHRRQNTVKEFKEEVHYEDKRYRERSPGHHQRQSKVNDYSEDANGRNYKSKSGRHIPEDQSNYDALKKAKESFPEPSSVRSSATSVERDSHHKRRYVPLKLSEEERAAKLRQMQLAAELHEEQRWKRIKNAEESDAQEAIQSSKSGGKNFLDTAQKSIYGAAEGGSSSIAESVRRRTHYSQGRSGGEGNAFRR